MLRQSLEALFMDPHTMKSATLYLLVDQRLQDIIMYDDISGETRSLAIISTTTIVSSLINAHYNTTHWKTYKENTSCYPVSEWASIGKPRIIDTNHKTNFISKHLENIG